MGYNKNIDPQPGIFLIELGLSSIEQGMFLVEKNRIVKEVMIKKTQLGLRYTVSKHDKTLFSWTNCFLLYHALQHVLTNVTIFKTLDFLFYAMFAKEI